MEQPRSIRMSCNNGICMSDQFIFEPLGITKGLNYKSVYKYNRFVRLTTGGATLLHLLAGNKPLGARLQRYFFVYFRYFFVSLRMRVLDGLKIPCIRWENLPSVGYFLWFVMLLKTSATTSRINTPVSTGYSIYR